MIPTNIFISRSEIWMLSFDKIILSKVPSYMIVSYRDGSSWIVFDTLAEKLTFSL